MNDRLQTLVHCAVLGLVVGWVLYIGKDIFVPIVFSILVAYVIVGLTRQMGRIPWLGRLLPAQIRYTLSILVIAIGLFAIGSVIIAYTDSLLALAPQFQQSLLAAIQKLAVLLRIESEPTWTSLRQDLLTQVNMQRLIGSTLASATSIAVTLSIVFLFVLFLLLEQRAFAAKLDNLSTDPRHVALIRQIVINTNTRIGSYLALKTFVSVLLALSCWAIMALFGLEFAAFLAMLIGLLNFVPYLGTVIGIVVPVVLALVQFDALETVLMLLLALAAAQFVIGSILDPYLLGNSLNLSPFFILMGLTVWSALWGIPGAFLAVPITAIITIVFSEFAVTRPIAVLLSKDGLPTPR